MDLQQPHMSMILIACLFLHFKNNWKFYVFSGRYLKRIKVGIFFNRVLVGCIRVWVMKYLCMCLINCYNPWYLTKNFYKICFAELYQIFVFFLFLFYFILLLGYFIEVLIASICPGWHFTKSIFCIVHKSFDIGPTSDAGPQKPISEKQISQHKMLPPPLPTLIYSEAPHLRHAMGLQIWIVTNSQNKVCYRNLGAASAHDSSYR